MKKNKKAKFDKYSYYATAVQSPEADIETFEQIYKETRGRKPISLREDFCGTFLICDEWVRTHKNNTAFGIDLDPVPIAYGFETHAAKLSEDQTRRLKIKNANVLDPQPEKVDLTVAVNFSYYTFKTRKLLKDYFSSALSGLNKDGVFLIDCFGGSDCYEPNQEITRFKKEKFNYIWHQTSFDPVTNGAQFEIHFKLKGGKLHKKAFQYDWRMWTIPELREVLEEVGFKKTVVYWEGTTKKGGGNGKFKPTEVGEDCESWIAYICAVK